MQKPPPIVNGTDVLSVAQASLLLKGVVETAFAKVKIKGEIHGLKHHSNGHMYLDLKEKQGGKDYIMNAIVWKWTKLSVVPKDGMEVIVTGKISTYPGRSSYNITIETMEVAGIGALLQQIEERKKKLAAEGLFDQARKKQIPFLPKRIGVVTSPTGSVIRDIIHRIEDRFPTHVLVWPAAVQGDGAENQIAAGIDGFNKLPDDLKPDVLIVARGGGSLQDLMPFNEEIVVRATANSEIPIISAVGHETDTTLIDFVSDLRAPTPTGAAEKAVPVRSELISIVDQRKLQLDNSVRKALETKKLHLDSRAAKILTPMGMIEDLTRRIDDKTDRLKLNIKQTLITLGHQVLPLGDRIKNTMAQKLKFTEEHLKNIGGLLDSYSFKKTLERGFAIAKSNDQIITSAATANKNQPTSLLFHDGEVKLENKKPTQSSFFD